MDFLNMMLQIQKPGGLWAKLIFGLESGIKNYGLTLIVITILIKFVLLPSDFFNRYTSRKNNRKQAKLKPELDKIKKTYASNPQMVNQKTMELYKRENYSVMGTCLGMLLSMVLTTVVFFTLFGSLQKISVYKQITQFTTLQTEYNTVYQENIANVELTEELDIFAKEQAQTAVIKKYDEIKDSFLWIKNIWKQDTNTNAILNYKEFKKIAVDLVVSDKNPDGITEEQYNAIIDPVKQEFGGNNGWYILTVLSASITFLSFKLTSWISMLKARKNNTEYVDPMGTNKTLIFIMPVIMALFTLSYTASFGIYIVAGALFGLITTPLINMLAETIDNKAIKRENEKVNISYSRKTK